MRDARVRLSWLRVGPLATLAGLLIAGAANEGCSGSGDAGGPTKSSVTDSLTKESCTCSASTPAAGATCDDEACEDVLCYYDNGCGQMNEWHCKEDLWQINTSYGCESCVCPASTPAAGAACDDATCAGVLCYYDNGCGQLNEWHCKEDVWQINTGYGCPSCTCPVSTPPLGAACDDTTCAGVLCYYDNGCGQMNEWHCKEDGWHINTGYGCP